MFSADFLIYNVALTKQIITFLNILKISEKYALYESLFCVIKLNTFIRTEVKIGQQNTQKRGYRWQKVAHSQTFFARSISILFYLSKL